jgi:hypothetical protein
MTVAVTEDYIWVEQAVTQVMAALEAQTLVVRELREQAVQVAVVAALLVVPGVLLAVAASAYKAKAQVAQAE